jgi:hypothetical protein
MEDQRITGMTSPVTRRLDRNATTNAFSGGSPPQCPKGHDLSDPDSYYMTLTRQQKCIRCRIAAAAALHEKHEAQRPAIEQARAAEKARRAAEREERRLERRAGRQLLLEARRIAQRAVR